MTTPTAPAGRMTADNIDRIKYLRQQAKNWGQNVVTFGSGLRWSEIDDLLAHIDRLQAPVGDGEVEEWLRTLDDKGTPRDPLLEHTNKAQKQDQWVLFTQGYADLADLLRRLSSALAEMTKERDEARADYADSIEQRCDQAENMERFVKRMYAAEASLSDAREKALEDLNEADNLRKVQLRNALAGLRCAVSIFDGLKMVGSNVLVVKHALREAETAYADEGTRALAAQQGRGHE